MSNDDITDPKENPTEGGHLPVSGEIGPIGYHDPLATDTSDDQDND